MKYSFRGISLNIKYIHKILLPFKKNLFTEERYLVKFNSIKKFLLLIKENPKKLKIPKRL